ncbi:MAG: DUF3486 family protein [Desulfuromonadales bacterium]|nr:DUF3486 family protein [Desulfuromonadales bacterium]
MYEKRIRSSIDHLPEEIRQPLIEQMTDPMISQRRVAKQINQQLQQQGHPQRISASAVSRYRRRMRKAAEEERQTQQIIEHWVDRLGQTPQGQHGVLILEFLRSLSFEVSHMLYLEELQPENLPAFIKMLNTLSLAVLRQEKTKEVNIDYEDKLRRRAREEEQQQPASAKGITPETMKKIHQAIGLE